MHEKQSYDSKHSDLLQFKDDVLVRLFDFEEKVKYVHPNYIVYKHSILELVKDLHEKILGFTIDSYVFNQMKASRNVLTVKYVKDNNLVV